MSSRSLMSASLLLGRRIPPTRKPLAGTPKPAQDRGWMSHPSPRFSGDHAIPVDHVTDRHMINGNCMITGREGRSGVVDDGHGDVGVRDRGRATGVVDDVKDAAPALARVEEDRQ